MPSPSGSPSSSERSSSRASPLAEMAGILNRAASSAAGVTRASPHRRGARVGRGRLAARPRAARGSVPTTDVLGATPRGVIAVPGDDASVVVSHVSPVDVAEQVSRSSRQI